MGDSVRYWIYVFLLLVALKIMPPHSLYLLVCSVMYAGIEARGAGAK